MSDSDSDLFGEEEKEEKWVRRYVKRTHNLGFPITPEDEVIVSHEEGEMAVFVVQEGTMLRVGKVMGEMGPDLPSRVEISSCHPLYVPVRYYP